MKKKLTKRKRKVQEGLPMELPADRGPKNCMCGICCTKPPSRRGGPGCEYYKHHCDNCHGLKVCTLPECLAEFAPTP